LGAHGGIAAEHVAQAGEVIAVQAGVASIAIARQQGELALVGDGAGGASGEETEGRGAGAHARHVADEGALDLEAAFGVGLGQPDRQALVEGRGGDEEGFAHLGPLDELAQALAQAAAIVGQRGRERARLGLRGAQPFAEGNQLVERQEGRAKREEVGRRDGGRLGAHGATSKAGGGRSGTGT
jgi:hypothetical protein